MSMEAVIWARLQRCGSTTAKIVLLLLADNCHQTETGTWIAYPGVRRISSDAEMTERSVRNALSVLKDRGLITARDRYWETGRQKTNEYIMPVRVTVHNQAVQNAPIGGGVAQGEGEPVSGGGGTCFTPREEPVSPSEGEPVSSPEPSSKKNQEQEPSTRQSSRACARTNDRGSRLPENWTPRQEDRDFAIKEHLNPDDILAEFVDYWRAVPGARGVKLDWSAVWRNRCRQVKSAPRGRGGPAKPESELAAFVREHPERTEALDRLFGRRPPEPEFEPNWIDGEVIR